MTQLPDDGRRDDAQRPAHIWHHRRNHGDPVLVHVAEVLLSECAENGGEQHALTDDRHGRLVLHRGEAGLEVHPHLLPARGEGEGDRVVRVRLRSPDLFFQDNDDTH